MTCSILLNHPAEMALTIGERMPKILIDNPAGDSITGLTSQSASFWDVSIFRHVMSNHCDAPFNTARAAAYIFDNAVLASSFSWAWVKKGFPPASISMKLEIDAILLPLRNART